MSASPPPPDRWTGAPAAPPTRRRVPRWMGFSAVLAVAAAAIGAILFLRDDDGDQAGADTATSISPAQPTNAPQPVTSVVGPAPVPPSTTNAPTTTTAVRMPDVIGMTQSEAEAALGDVGVTPTITAEEGPGAQGEIVSSTPRAGALVEEGETVTLVVRVAPTVVPAVVGAREDDATALFERYGVTVTVEERLDDLNPDGTVLEQTPAAGAPFATAVTLVVARRPVIAYLADAETVDNDVCSLETGAARINGELFSRSVLVGWCYVDAVSFVEYDLGRGYRRLAATVGPLDNVASSTTARVEIYVDNEPVFSQTLGLGQSLPIDLDVTGGLRLRLQVTEVSGSRDAMFGFGDARLLGLPSEVPPPVED